MEIREKIMSDVKTAMKEKETLKLNTLRFLQAAVKNREIDLRPNPITEEEVMGVIKKLVKQRKESIDQYKAGGRQDLVDQEAAELKILELYLPAQMSADKVAEIVKASIAKLGAKSPKDMGLVMKDVLAQTAGTADNKTVSEIIKSELAKFA